ncbi:MAG TPA: DegQ family serine endoprotease [Steroidobacteraceae bacterium]|jgi:serine protease Do/serine protease DegQ|nr:DegQ family serine endoprotease [Steroidobacteraceae bacterium]
MFRRCKNLSAALALGLLVSLPGLTAQPLDEAPVPTLAPMIKRVAPAVVNIATRGTIRERAPQNPLLEDPFFRRFFDIPDMGPRERQFQSAGSGVIFDAKNGYIVTNAHVVDNATEITVTLQDGRDLTATVVGSDVPSDVAVLKVPSENLIQIPLGDSAKLEQGDYVVAIGNPFGLQHSATFGMVSGVGRSGINPDGYEDFIQTDASINPGNSGGALVNLRGELVGINSAILSRSGGNIGIGFAIPVNMAHSIMDQLIKYGSVKRGLLGVNIYSLTPDMAKSLNLSNTQGVLVSQVTEGSAAEKAGIKAGDVITSINGQPIKSNSELRNAIGLTRVGDKLDVALIRDRKPLHVTAVITEPPPTTGVAGKGAGSGSIDTGALHPGLVGATLADAPNGGGVLVRTIEPRSAADLARLRSGDRIEGANGRNVANLAELREVAKRGGTLVLTVRRGNAVVLVPLRVP